MTSIHFRLKLSQASSRVNLLVTEEPLDCVVVIETKGVRVILIRVENQGISVEIREDRRISEVNNVRLYRISSNFIQREWKSVGEI